MRITAIETLRTKEFANVLWVRVHTDAGFVLPAVFARSDLTVRRSEA